MSVVGYRAKNHPQQVARNGARPEIDDRATTPETFDPLNARFLFTVDVAASRANAKCPRYYDEAADGLSQSWAHERVWCNPPFSRIRPWVEKAWDEPTATVVMLVPSNRTEQVWWQELVEPFRDGRDLSLPARLRTEFLPGRLRFVGRGADGVGPNERPPFGCVLLIWRPA